MALSRREFLSRCQMVSPSNCNRMLKITTRTDVTGTIFDLEGKLAGLWVRELENCWAQAAIPDQQIKVVLKAVTFIDDEGRKLLADMHQKGVKLTAEGCMTKAMVEEIMRGENS